MPDQNHAIRKIIVEQLGIRKDMRVWVGGHQIQAKKIIEPYLIHATKPPTGEIDIAFVAPESLDEAVYFSQKIQHRLTPHAMIWIVIDNEMNIDLTVEALTRKLETAGFSEKKKVLISDRFMAAGYTTQSCDSATT